MEVTRHPRDHTHPLAEAIASIIVVIGFVLFIGFLLGGIIHVSLGVLERGLRKTQ